MIIFYAVLSIALLYFLFAIFSGSLKKLIGKKICAICAAVSLTWLSLLILKFSGFKIDNLVIAILMGQSVVGLMTKTEKYFQEKGLPKFWLIRILIITGGTLFVYWLLKEKYALLIPLLIAAALLLPFFFSLINQADFKKPKNSKNYQKAISKLEKMMENCC